ncbi:MAG: nuclear transport factor 2 family protein [Chloroflexi bacterium]|nr:nuclear transport factor 2 family protein [Chloroflexota bacterium]
MSVEENKAIARRFVEEMMTGQHVDRIEEFVAPDAVHHEREGDHNYRQALLSVFGDPIHDWRFVVDDVIAEGDTVVVRCTASHTTWAERNQLGIPYKPGTRASVWHAHIFRIRDGKIVEHWPVREIWDAVLQFSAPALAEAASAATPA